ncbi:mechanosensitive ion channel domain-containing protein [Microbulbifer donghaiensis]|uniref:mechanosensitive ion channel domain-containing protein n=1 Tax=Microbulbifer donghaiensis TaxID=494016 RepID=UPI001F213097|nr:mechanosensitive ion channel domain-containing protein [Microbulbifer donghaiensis]
MPRILLTFFLSLLFACSSLIASAQLPGSEPKKFEPVIPDFAAPSADWWTEWTEASSEERQQWLEALTKAWQEWREKLPEDEALQKRATSIGQSLQGIEVTWKRNQEYQKVTLLPDIKFPEKPDVMDWAKADGAINRGRQRMTSFQLEARQLDQTLGQSLSQLRKQVILLREARDTEDREATALTLLRTQINHLNIIEQRDSLEEFLGTWQEKIDSAEDHLKRMLDSLLYSEEAAKALEKEIKTQSDAIEKIGATRTSIQGSPELRTDPVKGLQKDLTLMQLEVDLLEGHLKRRKAELLQSMNWVLMEGKDEEDRQLIVSRDLLETAGTIIESTSRELNLRQRQVSAWRGEEGEEGPDLSRWWGYFERIDSGLNNAQDLVKDILRYEVAQLQVYKERQGWWATVRERTSLMIDQAYKRWRQLADFQLFTIAQNPITLRDIAKIIFVMVCAWLISSFTRRFLNRLVRKKHASESSMYNLGRVLHYSIIAIAIIIVLSMLGLDTSKLALVAGALSVGIGFGMQAIFSNFISGLILLFEQPLRVGDLVELESGVFGRIRDINVRSTRITTRDNVDILVPNTEFVAGRVINHTLDDPVRRIHVPFGVAYGSDPDLVREAAMAAAERVTITHTDWKRKTEVWLMQFGDNSLNFKLVVWINSNMVSPLGDPYALYNLELLRELNEKGIEVPFPQRDLHVRSWDVPLPISRHSQK